MSAHTTPTIDLASLLDAAGDGVHWSLGDAEDLNANLVRLEPGHRIEDHVNHDVEVLLVVLSGHGSVHIDGQAHPLTPATVALVPRSSARRITAGTGGMAYLSIHRRRSGLQVRRAGHSPGPEQPRR